MSQPRPREDHATEPQTQQSTDSPWQGAQIVSPPFQQSLRSSPSQHPPSRPSTAVDSTNPERPLELNNGSNLSSLRLQSQVQSPVDLQTSPRSKSINHLSPARQTPETETVLPSIEADGSTSPSSRLQLSPQHFATPPRPGSRRSISQSRPNMATPTPSKSVTELLREARETAERREIARQQDARRAGSSIPSTPASFPSTPAPLHPFVSNQLIPTRDITASFPPARSSLEPESNHAGLRLLPLGSGHYVVPLTLTALVQSLYMDEIRGSKSAIRKFIGENEVSASTIEAVDVLVERLKMMCDHQDLVVEDTATQDFGSVEYIARWAENISTKCIFLNEFIHGLRDVEGAHIVVLSRPGRMMDILEACFKYRKFSYAEFGSSGRQESHPGSGPVQVTLIPTNLEFDTTKLSSVRAIIAFDSTYEGSPELARLAPVLHLVVNYSAEHLELCIGKATQGLNRTAALINGIYAIDEEVGRARGDFQLPDEAAKRAVLFIKSPSVRRWPISAMPVIDCIESFDSISKTPEPEAKPIPSSIIATPFSNTNSRPDNYPSPQPSSKRLLGVDDNSGLTKRQRMTPPIKDDHGDAGNESYISEITNAMSNGVPVFGSSAVNDQDQDLTALIKKVSNFQHPHVEVINKF